MDEHRRPTDRDTLMTIGEVAERTGLATSAIRYYESEGLVVSVRNRAGHRRYRRSVIRRLSFIKICQGLGYTLDEIGVQLDRLPRGRTPTERDWAKMAVGFAGDIDERIERLRTLREKLDGCIGCGCLSLERCVMYNNDDAAARLGPGPRYLLGDSADDL